MENKEDLLIEQVTGYFCVAEIALPVPPGIKRIHGFFDDKKELDDFVKNSPVKIIAIKKTTLTYRKGEGLNYG